MAVQRVVDRDAGGDRFVLRQLADGDGAAPGEIVDGGKIAGADAVRDGADIGIVGDAAVEDRLAVSVVAHLADQLDADLDGVAAFARPLAVGFVDRVDQPDGARGVEIDRHHLADRPQSGDGAVVVVGVCGDRGARAVALDDMAEHAVVGLRCAAPLLRGRLSGRGFPVNVHQWPAPNPDCPQRLNLADGG